MEELPGRRADYYATVTRPVVGEEVGHFRRVFGV